jgi:hypothetical protein
VEKCRSCGAEIIWADTAGGKPIPLNKTRAHGYLLNEHPPGTKDAHDAGLFYVSHFLTCPQASQWSGGKR